mgnify:CR=1 FL=1
MFTLKWFWSDFSFVAAFVTAVYLLAWKLPKRDHFVIRLSISFTIFMAFMVLWRVAMYIGVGNNSESYYNSLTNLLFYLFFYILVALSLIFTFKINFWTSLFCSTVGYSLQHISERLYEVIMANYQNIPMWLWFVLLTLITVAVYLIFFFFIIRRLDYTSFDNLVDHKAQTICSVITLATAIYLNSQLVRFGYGTDQSLGIIICSFSFSILLCLLIIILELSLVSGRRALLESQRLESLLMDEKRNYEEDKKNTELLNIKYHDIKHLINNSNPDTDPLVFKEIKNSLGIYESSVKTGNEAIDVIMSKKSKICKDEGIRLTCSMNGETLNYISPYELYALFENAMDNAIDAVSKCEKEKKIISITQTVKDQFLILNVANYYVEELVFKKGLPQTKKAKDYHGFGMRSMKMIVEKYDGRISVNTKEDLFILQIFLPLSFEKEN